MYDSITRIFRPYGSENAAYDDENDSHSITLNEVCERYYGYVYRRIFALTHDRDRTEDLTQETFLKVTRYFHTLKTQDNLKAWLWLVATRVVYDAMKDAKHYSLSYNDHATLDVESSRDDPERIYSESELMKKALTRLNASDRHALLSYHLENKRVCSRQELYRAHTNLHEVYMRLLRRDAREAGRREREAPVSPLPLTSQQERVLRLYMQDMKQQAMAGILGIKRGTIPSHLAIIQRKLGLSDRESLKAWALAHGYGDEREEEAS